MKRNQTGAALIVVMVFLIVIAVVGTLAIRQSMVTLNIATNSQVQQLVIQNSDSAFFNVENVNNLAKSLSASGMFGYISNANDKNKELVFCYRGDQSEFFNIANANIMQWESGKSTPTNNSLGVNGYCDARQSVSGNWFTSGRRAVMTQVSVKFSTEGVLNPFEGRALGSDPKGGQIEEVKRVKIFAVSLMPTLTSVSRTDINTCLQSRMNEITIPEDTPKPSIATGTPDKDNVLKTVTECLTNLNVPFTTQVSEYNITQDFS
ncbi:pilus assembly PilX N-terminal domain-containing protein [Acinetobacter sp.]|uniref:pilus assembly PilX family protein n=1 Tax=Acinetobacter sp. TaxID=472 RepID=UPI0028AA0FE1|nr:pilus assembly PilX N-terminal domain-containing protein [Acinetobacter sp.]